MKKNNSFYSVVIPVYNSQKSLPILAKKLHSFLKKFSKKYEVIFVNDGSSDNSWKTISNLASKHAWVRGIDLMRNYGQHNALLCGIRMAKGNIIITIDDDLQHPILAIPKLINKLNKGFDVVYGVPIKEQQNWWRNIASQFTKIAIKTSMKVDIITNISAFRVFKTELRDSFNKYQTPFISIDVLLTWGTTKFSAIEVKFNKRKYGKSKYSFSKLITHAFNMITGFSTLPLQVASILGLIFVIFGFFLLIYIVGRFVFEGNIVPGFPFLASIITIFSGVQLFTLGIIGEYLSRIYSRLLEQPQYVIKKQTKL